MIQMSSSLRSGQYSKYWLYIHRKEKRTIEIKKNEKYLKWLSLGDTELTHMQSNNWIPQKCLFVRWI